MNMIPKDDMAQEALCETELKSGNCTITGLEVMEMPPMMDVGQYILGKMKAKGAPINGKTWLSCDDNYIFTTREDFLSDKTKYKWEPKRIH